MHLLDEAIDDFGLPLAPDPVERIAREPLRDHRLRLVSLEREGELLRRQVLRASAGQVLEQAEGLLRVLRVVLGQAGAVVAAVVAHLATELGVEGLVEEAEHLLAAAVDVVPAVAVNVTDIFLLPAPQVGRECLVLADAADPAVVIARIVVWMANFRGSALVSFA